MRRLPILRIALGLGLILALAGGGVVGYNFYIGQRTIQEFTTFVDALDRCGELDQQFREPLSGQIMSRSVSGNEDGTCAIAMESFADTWFFCDLPQDERAIFADGMRAQLANLGAFGGVRIQMSYDSANPDALFQVMNGPNCRTEL